MAEMANQKTHASASCYADYLLDTHAGGPLEFKGCQKNIIFDSLPGANLL